MVQFPVSWRANLYGVAACLGVFISCTGQPQGKIQPFQVYNVELDLQATDRLQVFIGMDGRYGYLKANGDTAIRPVLDYDACFSFSGPLGRVIRNGRFGYINRKGELAIEPAFVQAGEFSEGLAPVLLDPDAWLWGYISPKGEVRIPPRFHYASSFSGGAATVSLDGIRYRLLPDGQTRKLDHYEDVLDYSQGFAVALKDSRKSIYLFLNRNGDPAFNGQVFKAAGSFSDGLATVADTKTGLYGAIDTTGRYRIPPTFANMRRHAFGRIPVLKDGGWGYAASNGEVLTPTTLRDAGSFNEGVAAVVTEQGALAYVDTSFRPRIQELTGGVEAEYSRLSESVCRRMYGGKYGYVTLGELMVVEPRYDNAMGFSNGVATVFKADSTNPNAGFCSVINKRSQVLLPFKYPVIYAFSDGGLAPAMDPGTGKYGVINLKGEFVVPPTYADADERYAGGLLAVKKADPKGEVKWGFINRKGEVVIPLEYFGYAPPVRDRVQVYKNDRVGHWYSTSGKKLDLPALKKK
jgi:hypothetical protein